MDVEEPAQAKSESIEARLSRVERSLFRLHVLLLIALVCALVPPIGGIVGAIVYVLLIAGAVVVFIVLVMQLLDRAFGARK
jgi:hypothetical protein